MSPSTPVIHVVDDDPSLRTALTRLLKAAGYEVRTYPSAGDFLLSHPEDAPGCILLDLHMPGPSGLDLQEALAMQTKPLPVIFITGYGDIPTSVRAMKAGAVDFLTKPIQRDELLNAVRSALVREDESRVVREQLRLWRECFHTLNRREREVFDRVVAGKLNKEIAAELGAAERTVKAHRARVMEKMQAGSLAELVHIADQLKANRV